LDARAALADRLDRTPTREGPTRDEIADTAQDAAADCGKPLDPDVADVIAARVLALSPTEPCATCGGTRVIAQDSHSPCVECDPPCPDCSQPEDWDGPYDRWVPGERIRVCEHPTDGEGADERKWTRAFTRLEKAVQRHRDAKGWTDDADDELHRVLEKVLRDVGPAPARARSDVDEVLRGLTFRRERSRPVFRNKHTGTEVVVLDLAVDDRGGFQGGCRQFTVVTDEPGPPGYKTRGPYSLDSFVQHWEPTGEHVPVDRDRIRERLQDTGQ
jgi:hypothetical protein